MSDYDPGRREYFRNYMRKRREANRVVIAYADVEQCDAGTIISFLPESPQLEADWRAVLADTRRERAVTSDAKWGF
jgi:hypothetical protein